MSQSSEREKENEYSKQRNNMRNSKNLGFGIHRIHLTKGSLISGGPLEILNMQSMEELNSIAEVLHVELWCVVFYYVVSFPVSDLEQPYYQAEVLIQLWSTWARGTTVPGWTELEIKSVWRLKSSLEENEWEIIKSIGKWRLPSPLGKWRARPRQKLKWRGEKRKERTDFFKKEKIKGQRIKIRSIRKLEK